MNESRCLTCKTLIKRKYRGRRIRKYCNIECYKSRGANDETKIRGMLQDALNDRPIFCCQCGKQFVRKRLDQVCCSKPCHNKRHHIMNCIKRRAIRLWENTTVVDCDQCGKVFTTVKKGQLYCSKKCSNAHKREQRRLAKLYDQPALDLS